MLATVQPRLDDIAAELAELSALRDKPAGRVRISAHDHAIVTILWPKLLPVMRQYPDIEIEFGVDYAITDIVAERFDAGVRSGDMLDQDMIAVRINPDLRMAVAASPAYLLGKTAPQTPRDLVAHPCIKPAPAHARRPVCLGV